MSLTSTFKFEKSGGSKTWPLSPLLAVGEITYSKINLAARGPKPHTGCQD